MRKIVKIRQYKYKTGNTGKKPIDYSENTGKLYPKVYNYVRKPFDLVVGTYLGYYGQPVIAILGSSLISLIANLFLFISLV